MMQALRIRRGRRARSNGRLRFAFRVRPPAHQPLQFCLDRPPDGAGMGEHFLAYGHQA
jgi:hypothetical protein